MTKELMGGTPDETSLGTILIHLGRLEGMLTSIMQRQDAIEATHRRELDNVTERLNRHSEAIDRVTAAQAKQDGAETGKKAVIGLAITCVVMAAGFAVWFLSNGLNLLQAGAKSSGG